MYFDNNVILDNFSEIGDKLRKKLNIANISHKL